MSYSGLCVDCKKINTTQTDENGNFLCVTCSNKKYYLKLHSGEIIELKLDMNKIQRSTYLKIRSLMQSDLEDYELRQQERGIIKEFIDRCNMNDRFPELVKKAQKVLRGDLP